jgi:hypothetical protein
MKRRITGMLLCLIGFFWVLISLGGTGHSRYTPIYVDMVKNHFTRQPRPGDFSAPQIPAAESAKMEKEMKQHWDDTLASMLEIYAGKVNLERALPIFLGSCLQIGGAMLILGLRNPKFQPTAGAGRLARPGGSSNDTERQRSEIDGQMSDKNDPAASRR